MATQILDVLEKLSDERQTIIYRLALDMLLAQEQGGFDSYSLEDIREVMEAKERISKGDCLTFLSMDEMRTHFNV